jgi:hypothetical protein
MTRSEEQHLLMTGASEMGLALAPATAETLLSLVDELQAGNAQFNLTAIRDRPGMLRKHILDSLSLQPHLRGARLADVGTGAGFPGMPLAIVNPQRHFSLIEATREKGALRLSDRRAHRLRQCRGRTLASRDLSSGAALRYRRGPRTVFVVRFHRVCRSFVRAQRTAAGDEGQASR